MVSIVMNRKFQSSRLNSGGTGFVGPGGTAIAAHVSGVPSQSSSTVLPGLSLAPGLIALSNGAQSFSPSTDPKPSRSRSFDTRTSAISLSSAGEAVIAT